MSRNYKFHNQDKPYFITFATVYWLDVFIRPIYRNILVDSINYCVDEIYENPKESRKSIGLIINTTSCKLAVAVRNSQIWPNYWRNSPILFPDMIWFTEY